MTLPPDIWSYCNGGYAGNSLLPSAEGFILRIRRELKKEFHDNHCRNGQIPMSYGDCGYFCTSYYVLCNFCHDANYEPSDKEIIEKACQMPSFAIHFNQLKGDFIQINVFMNRLTKCGSGLEDYKAILSLKMSLQQIFSHVLNKIKETSLPS